jgi:hypothetical protein
MPVVKPNAETPDFATTPSSTESSFQNLDDDDHEFGYPF